MNKINWTSIACINMAVAIGCGAFGAHYLKTTLSTEQLAWWHTGTDYLFYQALGLLIVSTLIRQNLTMQKIALVMQIGSVVFSGSLYLMALGLPRWLGAITPLGGSLMLLAWVWLAVVLHKKSSTHKLKAL
ncbi:hypothetical protein MOMA_08566 [Moraxella macacae 0408225]|uniref:DUF423 domain-containing protein n=1 Tax=Moraxella macacae 0408225 TaxID=1230338 RepID=L2F774_9GAMM|nr:DUF423 domain-containing protein [Moraxella macacae]ELA08601.1 hypothetical protein MOMA_08566 [Moraxella macacae 0408225]